MLRSRLAAVLLASSLLALTGCSGNSISNPPPPASATLDLSVTSLAFSNTTVGQATDGQTVTLSSTGGLAVNISSITNSDPADYGMTDTCSAPLPVSSTCTVSVIFKPQSAVTLPATITIASNATGSPQTITLSGTGTAAPTPSVALSPTTLTFTATQTGVATAAQTVTLTNSGSADLDNLAITLTGANASDFALGATTCGATLAAAANCTVAVTFTAPASNTNYAATLQFIDNASDSPQTVALTGSGPAFTTSYQMYVLPDPGSGAGSGFMPAMQQLIGNAQKTIDMTMYELEDSTFTGWLTAACARGVTVRVIMDQGELSSSGNKSTFNTLNSSGANCSAVASNKAFENTHQKSMTVDGATTVIMSLNLQSQYYSTTRDFAMVENDPADIAAIEATFAQDYAAGTPSGGTAGASDFSYTPAAGTDLIWSPTTAKADMLSIIQNATKTLLIENEELASSAGYIISALTTACQNGVTVHLAIVDESDYESNFTTLKNAGCGVATVPDSTKGFYIHAKAVVADYGLPTQSVYMGSINYSNASMTENRELGMYVTDQPSIDIIENVMSSDYTNATPW